ncbi:MAG: hypothetical protein JW995_08325 [Melioribacteraceae bacterium]|nr:hypothetical protein [Melioribacteraceae bacterium]
MFSKKNFTCLPVILLLIFTACSGPALFNVQPEDKNYEWYQGRKILTGVQDSVIVSLNFEHQEQNNFVFYLYVKNESSVYLNIDPAGIFFVSDRLPEVKNRIYAYDPEKEIENINLNINDLKEGQKVERGANCLFAAFDVVADIFEGDGEEAAADAGYWVDEMIADEEEYEINHDILNQRKMFWENETFRITALKKDGEAGGLIFFPVIETLNQFTVVIEINEKVFRFGFRQIKR